MLARIIVVSLLMVLALPVVYLGILGIYGMFIHGLMFIHGFAIFPSLVLVTLAPIVVLSALGTLISLRFAVITAGALALFYLGWALTVYPFPGLLPNSFFYWARMAMFIILCLNLGWIIWSRREVWQR